MTFAQLSNTATARSSTSSDGLRSSLLFARNARQLLLEEGLERGFAATVTLGLNIPGGAKILPGCRPLFAWGVRRLLAAVPESVEIVSVEDALGPFALFGSNLPAAEVKRLCIALERRIPAARLLDFDVHEPSGSGVDRARLGIAPRPCLLCPQPAVECMRTGRHSLPELSSRAHELLRPFFS